MAQGENIAQREPLGLSVGSAADQLAGFVHVETVRARRRDVFLQPSRKCWF